MYKVFLIYSMHNSGGTERVVANLANEWSKKEKIEIIVTTSKKNSFYNLSSNVKIVNLNIEPYRKNPISVMCWLARITIKVYQYIKIHKPDFILGIWTSMAICGIIAGKFADVKSIACEHISYDFTKRALKVLRRLVYPFSSAVITLTKDDKNKFEKYCNRVACIENSVSFSSEQYPLYSAKVVLAVGRVVEQKGFDLLLYCWAEVIQQNPDWKLIILGGIIGDDKYSCQLKKIIDDKNLHNSIEIHPPTKEIMKYFFNASIFVLSSRYEGLPMVMIEAMTAGLPIISFDCPTGPKELIEDNGNGFLISHLNVKEMENKLNILMNNEHMRRKFGMHSKKIVIKRYAITIIKEKWNKLFLDLA